MNNYDPFYTATARGSVTYRDAAPLNLPYGKFVTGVDLTSPVEASVSGHMMLNGKALTGDDDITVLFSILDSAGHRLDGASVRDEFRIADLAAGTYYLSFAGDGTADEYVVPEYYEDADTLSAATPIVLRAGQRVSGIVAALATR